MNHQSPRPAAHATNSPPGAWQETVLRGSLVALCVATPLVPSEAMAQFGGHVVLAALGNLLLLAWLLVFLARNEAKLVWNIGLTALALFVAWQGVSVFVCAPTNNVRFALNTLWYWESAALTAFLVTQLVRTPPQIRGMCAALLALAVGLACLALYQYFFSIEQRRLAFEANAERALEREGWFAPPGSPQREHFMNRVRSKEPYATFALTNSLAGYLAPWLVLAAGIFLAHVRLPIREFSGSGDRPRAGKQLPGIWRALGTRFGLGLAAAVVVAAIWFTQSRAAFVAVGVGLASTAVLVYREGSGSRHFPAAPRARRAVALVAGGTVLAVLGASIWFAGRANADLLAGAPRSLLFRLEYWQATARLILDHPWFGCGPGNFQEFYTGYKLPQASESVRDPHNFVLEIWATAGTPALLLFLGVLAAWCAPLWRQTEGEGSGHLAARSSSLPENATWPWEMPAGAALGMLAGWPLSFLVGFSTELMPIAGTQVPAWLAVGFVPALLVLWLLGPWMARGELPRALPLVAGATLLVNLLAAGGIAYPGVALTLWVLGPVGLASWSGSNSFHAVSRGSKIAALAVALVAFVLFHQSGYAPVLQGRSVAAEGDALFTAARTWFTSGNTGQAYSDLRHAERQLVEAVALDRFAAAQAESLTGVRFLLWLLEPTAERFAAFERAAADTTRKNPQAANWRQQLADLYLRAYRHSNQAEHLQAAVAQYREAVHRYGNSSLLRAQLAWALHLQGAPESAAEAGEALRLDALMPHAELKLARLSLADSGPATSLPPEARQLPAPRGTAEQVLLGLRK